MEGSYTDQINSNPINDTCDFMSTVASNLVSLSCSINTIAGLDMTNHLINVRILSSSLLKYLKRLLTWKLRESACAADFKI